MKRTVEADDKRMLNGLVDVSVRVCVCVYMSFVSAY
jgi:hypothetical protein